MISCLAISYLRHSSYVLGWKDEDDACRGLALFLRLQGKPLLPQPPRVEPPLKRVVYSREGDGSLTFEGVLREGEEVPSGMILKLERY